jgi:hypothetical protein
MSEESDYGDGLLSPDEMKDWLRVLTREVEIASTERLQDAATFVASFINGTITREEAESRRLQHMHRWGKIAADAGTANRIHDQAVNEVYRLGSKTDRSPGTTRSR